MLTDSERFAFTARRHHAFATTGNAYDASQCDETIHTGDTLVILSKQAVAIAVTLPFAVTANSGKLHSVAAPRPGETLADIANALHVSNEDFAHAIALARALRFPLDPNLEPLLADV